jgi:integrase
VRPPKFPLDRDTTYGHVKGCRLFFHHGSWGLRFRRGRKFEESLSTTDDRLAWAELEKASKQIVEGLTPQEIIGARHPESLTVAEAAKTFLTEYTEIALGTQRKLRGIMSQWLIGETFDLDTGEWTRRADAVLARPFGALEIHSVEKRDVREVLRKVRTTDNRLGRLNTRATAKIVLDAVRLLFNWLIDEGRLRGKDGHVLANPAARCGRFTFDAEQDTKATGAIDVVHVFEPDQEAALVAWYQTRCRRLYPAILCGVDAGLRYGEMVAVEIDDFDPVRHRLSISKHWTPEGLILGTKSNRAARGVLKVRAVPTDLGHRLEPALNAHIAWLRETRPRGWDGRRLFPAAAYTKADGSTNVGAYITPNNFYRAVWRKACLDVGIKGLSYHSLRHTFASRCLHAGATPQEVAAWLGDTLEVTLRCYAHIIKGLERDRAGLLGASAPVAGARALRVVR